MKLREVLISFFLIILFTTYTKAAPVLTNVSAVRVSDVTAGISLTTNTTSFCSVVYGLTTSYGAQTIIVPTHFFNEHFITLYGLVPNSLYHYKVTCTDASTTSTTDIDRTFTTQAVATVPRLPIPLDPNLPNLSGATVKTVRTSGGNYTLDQLQTAINDAIASSGNRIIDVEAGQVISGNFTIGVKVDNSCIQIRSSNYNNLRIGKRVTPTDVANLVRIRSNNIADPALAVFRTVGASRCTIFTGIEITIDPSIIADAPGGTSQTKLVMLGTAAETSQSQLPSNFRFDRCWIHGIDLKNTKRGIYVNAEKTVFIDSTIERFQDTNGDSQAILIGTAKQLLVWNCYVNGAGENVLSGGVDQTITGYATSDLEFRYSDFPWLLKWKSNDPSWDGKDWVTKNNFEIKKGEAVLIFACNFGPWWESEQTGGTISFKTSNDDPNPIVIAKDILVYLSRFRNVGAGIVINGSNNTLEESTDHTRRISFLYDLFEIDGITFNNEDSGNPSSGNMSLILTSYQGGVKHYPDDFSIEHCTFVNSRGGNRVIHLFDTPATGTSLGNGFIFRNNILTYNIFGIKADGTAEGTASLNVATDSATRTWSKNLINGSSTNYPTDNTYVSSATDIQFVDFNNGFSGGNFKLRATSPGKNAASDGTDMGYDKDRLDRAISGTISGSWLGSISQCNWNTDPVCN